MVATVRARCDRIGRGKKRWISTRTVLPPRDSADANDVAFCFMVGIEYELDGRRPRRGPVRALADERARPVAADLARARPLPAPAALAAAHRGRRARELDGELLLALTNDQPLDARTSSPPGRSPRSPGFDDELAALRGRPARRACATTSPRCTRTRTRPARARAAAATGSLRRIVRRAGSDYWDACFEPWWPRMRTVLEADIVLPRPRRSRRDGLAAMFADLVPAGPAGRRRRAGRADAADVASAAPPPATGLTLAPIALHPQRDARRSRPTSPRCILYGARGVGTLWESEPPRGAGDALAGLIGGVRARLLAAARSRRRRPPSWPSASASRPRAVNQHLRAMRAAGLLTAARHGRSVLYLRSDLGDRADRDRRLSVGLRPARRAARGCTLAGR